jgi:hypothetical protein
LYNAVKGAFSLCAEMKNLIYFFSCLLCVGILLSNGCDLAKPQNKGQEKPPAVQEGPQQPEAQQADVPPNPVEQKEPAQNANESDAVMVKAEVGVGSKGSSYAKPTGGPMDMITVPISTSFRMRERVSFLLVDDAMNKFKAMSENGKGPTSHEEFMEKIVKANNIKLPQLFYGQSYIYDPADEQLKVRKPRNAQ